LPRIQNQVFLEVGLKAGKGVRRVQDKSFFVDQVKDREDSNNQPQKGVFRLEFRLAEEKGADRFEQQGVF
jgi:hypothetical protein